MALSTRNEVCGVGQARWRPTAEPLCWAPNLWDPHGPASSHITEGRGHFVMHGWGSQRCCPPCANHFCRRQRRHSQPLPSSVEDTWSLLETGGWTGWVPCVTYFVQAVRSFRVHWAKSWNSHTATGERDLYNMNAFPSCPFPVLFSVMSLSSSHYINSQIHH